MISSLLQKPFSGGTPAIDSEPMAEVAAVSGMRLARPPILSRERVPVDCSIAPAFRKSSDLNRAWLNRWNRPPMMPSGVPMPKPRTT